MQNKIDPALIPFKILSTGDKMPAMGMGTFGSDHASADAVAGAVRDAAAIGYRLFDCASVYGNEAQIGEILTDIQSGGVRREDMFVMSKVWNDAHDKVVESCKNSLHDLRLDYLDAYFIHWPFPNSHPPHCDVNARNPYAKPYSYDEFMSTWAQLESLVDEGLVRNLGLSNVTVSKLSRIIEDAKIKPVLNEMELHPSFQQPELFQFSVNNHIQPVGYCPVGSPNRPERDHEPDDVNDFEMPSIAAAAKAHGIHPAVVCLKWSVQRGSIPIPFSTKAKNLYSNLEAITNDPLTDAEMQAIASEDANCRFIKGHVFLWESAVDWRDLWK